ncbi:MAG: hypothetical protein ACQESG_05070 [Nanobdellota archaeon]
MAAINLDPTLVKFKGVFDFQNLFQTIYDWLDDHEYEVNEKIFKHKIPTPKGAEKEIEWAAHREVTHYIKYNINFKFRIFDLRDVEIQRGEQKLMKSYGKVRVTISPVLEVDYNDVFSGNKFKQFLGKLFNDRVYDPDIGALYADPLQYRMYQLQALIKQTLDMDAQYNAFEGRD